MKAHFTHRFSATERLEMMEYSSNRFDVAYLTQEGIDEEGRECWYVNNPDIYTSFNDAKKGFNDRLASENPFKTMKNSY